MSRQRKITKDGLANKNKKRKGEGGRERGWKKYSIVRWPAMREKIS